MSKGKSERKKEEPEDEFPHYEITSLDVSNETNEMSSLKDSIATSSQTIINGYNRLEGTFSTDQKTIANEFNLKPNIEKMNTDIKKLLNGQKEQIEHSKTEAVKEGIRFKRGVILGLLLGIFGNLFVSYLMKTLEIFNVEPYWWAVATIVGFVLTILLVIILEKKGSS